MSGSPNMLTMCLNTLSLSFHSEDRSNILEFLSATTFSDPGMWAAETRICHSAVHNFKFFCFFSLVNVIVMCKESIMTPKKVICCFGIISDFSILM